MKKKPSSVDVAELAGVSTATVSYVFNGRKNASVPLATRSRVLEAAESIGYRPNRLARSLAGGKTHLVGMVTRLDSFDVRIASPARSELAKRGYQTLLAHSNEHYELDEIEIESLLEHQVDALLCVSGGWGNPKRPLVTSVIKEGVPCVIVNDLEATGRIDSVVSDNRAGARAVVAHLAERGHRRIGLVSSSDSIYTGRERTLGYIEGLREVGLDYDPQLIQGDGYSAKIGYEAARRMLTSAERPTAIFGANDANAMGAYHAALDLGLRIPADVAIAGFGNEREAEALMMTTVDQHPGEMARFAVERLFNRMTEPEITVSVRVVPVDLVPGRTT